MKRENRSTVDTAPPRMDSKGHQMMIVGVAMLDKAIGIAQLKDVLASRFLSHRRFRSKVVQDVAGAWWQEVGVDLDQHVVRTALPKPALGASNKPALQALVGTLSR